MDKKTKLLLGVGVVGVGAYLLFKSKKATPALTSVAPAPAKFVGADSFASVGENEKFTNMAGVGDRMIAQDGTKFASVGVNYRPVSGGMINSTDVVGARAGSQNSGIFANQPFTGDVANMVGASGDKVFANQTGKFFKPRTARYGQNEGVFAPKKKSPVEPNRPMPVTQDAPLNNMVGANGGFFNVTDATFVNR
jgi:hypothetical protein